jgi:hypothetical protein
MGRQVDSDQKNMFTHPSTPANALLRSYSFFLSEKKVLVLLSPWLSFFTKN